MPKLGKKHFPYTKAGHKAFIKAVAKKKKDKLKKKKKKKVVRKKK
jgi:hypothetical protein